MFSPVNNSSARAGFILLAGLLFSFTAFAQDNQEKDLSLDQLLEMNLDDLLNLDVVTAGKTSQKADDAYAAITVITREQIAQRGYRHLSDVLNDIVDNHQDRSNWGIGEPVNQNVSFGYRFDTGQNMLLLFNGQRLNAFLPGNRFGGEEYLTDNIERIEVVRGPGSALYGANAFTAVINVISKTQPQKETGSQLTAGVLGNAGSEGLSAQVSGLSKIGRNSFISGSGSFLTEKGQQLLVKNALFGNTNLRDGVERAFNADLFFSRNALRLYAKATNQKRNTFTGFNGISPADMDNLNLSTYAYSLGGDYALKLGRKLEMKVMGGWHQDNWREVARIPLFKTNAAGDSLERDAAGHPILDTVTVSRNGVQVETPFVVDGQGADTRTLDAELQLTYNYVKSNNLIFGLSFTHDQILRAERPSEIQLNPFEVVAFRTFTDPANNWLLDANASRLTMGAYAQVDYQVSPSLSLNAGARLDMFKGTGALDIDYQSFNPRAALIWKNSLAGNFKLMYGRAYRVPNGFETLSSVSIQGSPNNRPENINNIQLQWIKGWSNTFRTEAGGFYTNITNHLETSAGITELQKAQGFIGKFANVPGARLQTSGMDVSLYGKLGKTDLMLNFTQFLYTDNNGEEIAYIPKTMVNTSVNIPVSWLNINLGANYRGNFTKAAGDPREAVKDYVIVNANLIMSLPNLPLKVRVGARNLLNTGIRHPSSSVDFTDHFPGRKLELIGGISYQFN